MDKVKLKLKDDKVKPLNVATQGSAGMDLYAHSFIAKYSEVNHKLTESHMELHSQEIHIDAGERVLVGTGLSMAIPKGYVLDIRPRSGHALKQGLIVVNSPGTIDSDYRGEIGVILSNITNARIRIKIGDAIAQGVFLKHEMPTFTLVDNLDATERGEGGFGSTSK